ncbi:MAG: hypothetical protein HQL21_03170 [Candidatus Omnitrophica bacterium]|nr:hypothetical protein [Candidatus Omnitrophota bacterium]
MTFHEFLGEVKKVHCQEVRAQEMDYCEVVVRQEAMGQVTSLLDSYFGGPFKPAGVQASPEALRHSAPYGGVQANQTIYCRQGEHGFELALLWPWGNGQATTVKIIHDPNQQA